MSVLFEIAEGWTGVLGPFTLLSDGVAGSLSGLDVELILRNASGTAIVPGGTITLLDQGTFPGKLTYTPVAADFVFDSRGNSVRQPFLVRWKVTDGAGKIVYYPNGEYD